MATQSPILSPPFFDPVLIDSATGQEHSQAWTEYHQTVADRVSALASKAGVTDGSDAAEGDVGEYITASSGTIMPSTGAVNNIVTLPLTAGDWDVAGNVIFNPSSGIAYAQCSISTASGAIGPIATRIPGAASSVQIRIGTGGDTRVSAATATTVYLTAQVAFSGSMSVTGTVWARRVR